MNMDKMTDSPHTGIIRPKVICIFRNGNRILVADLFDPTKKQHFYCPPGGGIEFGESSETALHREMREEFNTEIEAPCLLGVIENRFIFDGRQGHEIVFVYDAQLADRSLYELDRFIGHESIGDAFNVTWLDLDTSGPQTLPVYPDGLLELLNKDH
jgi:8-oxo-dGTP pyrophosphatase MutT (NUDIX family)